MSYLKQQAMISNGDDMKNESLSVFVPITCMILTGSLVAILVLMSGCSYSFQNILTNGEATDLVDDTQTADPTVSPNISANIPDLTK